MRHDTTGSARLGGEQSYRLETQLTLQGRPTRTAHLKIATEASWRLHRTRCRRAETEAGIDVFQTARLMSDDLYQKKCCALKVVLHSHSDVFMASYQRT
jgi:hypothetical protein